MEWPRLVPQGFPDWCGGRSQTEGSKLRNQTLRVTSALQLYPIITMAKSDPVFSHYFKARFRPLMQPKLWASAGIFCLSAYVLVRMFVQPDSFLGTADDQRTGAANLEANANLSPEEQAIAAELDDIAVLLEALDDEGTIESAVANDSLARAQQQSDKSNNKLPDVDLDPLQIDIPDADYGQFNSLPLLDLNPVPGNRQTATLGQSRGFVGFNSVSTDPALNLPTLSTSLDRPENQTNNLSPLQQALNRYAPGASSTGGTTQGTSVSSPSSAVGQTSSSTSIGSTTASQTSVVGTSTTTTGSTLTSPSNFPAQLTPGQSQIQQSQIQQSQIQQSQIQQSQVQQSPTSLTTPVPNAFTQLQNPQFSVPTVPQSTALQPSTPTTSIPTVPTLQAPVTTAPAAQPQFGSTPTSTGQFSGSQQQFSGNASNSNTQTFTNPAVTNTPVFPQAPGTPVFQQPTQTTPAFSVPNSPPGQNIGGGQINTFSNP